MTRAVNQVKPFKSHPKVSGLETGLYISDTMLEAIDLALAEDVGPGDATTSAVVPADYTVQACVVVKNRAVLAGMEVLTQTFKRVDSSIDVSIELPDGSYISSPPAVCALVRGKAQSILAGERTALNFIQRMSGIATLTSDFVQLAKPYGITILDTRKTTPCLRAFEKYAVRAGGGTNHRLGLYDAILIKDNHICVAGGITQAVKLARLALSSMRIEVETTTEDEVIESLNAGVDAILLDNMSPELVRKAVQLISLRCYVEVSGGINLNNIKDYLIPGVDAISIGAITHSAPSVDISLEVQD